MGHCTNLCLNRHLMGFHWMKDCPWHQDDSIDEQHYSYTFEQFVVGQKLQHTQSNIY